MNKKVKQLWIDALLSGKYKMGQSQLRVGDEYCVLGILCDLYNSAGWRKETFMDPSPAYTYCTPGAYNYGGSSSFPGLVVLEWAGLSYQAAQCLMFMNDADYLSPAQLVEMIEKL